MSDNPVIDSLVPETVKSSEKSTEISQDALVEIPAPGNPRKVSMKEALILAGKGAAFDEKAREAADLRKQLEAALQKASASDKLSELSRKVRETNDPQAVKELAMLLGESEESANAMANQYVPDAGSEVSAQQLPKDVMDTVLEMRRMLDGFKTAGIDPVKATDATLRFQSDQVDAWKKNSVDSYLTSDPILGKMMRTEHGETIRLNVLNRVKALEASGKPFALTTIQEASQYERVLADAVDKAFPSKVLQPNVFGVSPGPTSLPGSRLQPLKAPDMKDPKYQGDGGMGRYATDFINYRNMTAENG